jgi:alpha-D-ribose 1-methylphosphonate 5-triphosphate synthase subunit PhnI
MSTDRNTKKVFVDVFTDFQQKFLKSRLDHTRGYLTTFINDERKVIAHRFLDRVEQAIEQAYEEALEEDAELYAQKNKKKGKYVIGGAILDHSSGGIVLSRAT